MKIMALGNVCQINPIFCALVHVPLASIRHKSWFPSITWRILFWFIQRVHCCGEACRPSPPPCPPAIRPASTTDLQFHAALSCVCSHGPFCSILDDGDLGGKLGQNCGVASDTAVRCVVEFDRMLRRFRIEHKQIKHDSSSNGGTACTSGRDSAPVAKEVRPRRLRNFLSFHVFGNRAATSGLCRLCRACS